MAPRGSPAVPAILDLAADAAHIEVAVEFFDADPGPDHPFVQETGLGDPLGQAFEQANLDLRADAAYAGDQVAVVDDLGDLVLLWRVRANLELQVDAQALTIGALIL